MIRFTELVVISYTDEGEREFPLCSDVLSHKAVSRVLGTVSC